MAEKKKGKPVQRSIYILPSAWEKLKADAQRPENSRSTGRHAGVVLEKMFMEEVNNGK